MTRDRLPSRRRCSVRIFQHGGMRFSVCAGYHADGRMGEVFISSDRPGSDLDSVVGDAAICISLALQHGSSIEVIRHALQRDKDGSPATLLRTALRCPRNELATPN
jgi:hypothetical protein